VPRVVTFSFPEKKKITKKKRIGYRRSQPRHSEKDIKLLVIQIIGKEKDNQKEKNWLSPFTTTAFRKRILNYLIYRLSEKKKITKRKRIGYRRSQKEL